MESETPTCISLERQIQAALEETGFSMLIFGSYELNKHLPNG
jgi:hypothetical protein